MSEDEKFMKDVYKNGVPLKIVGIVKPTSSSGSLTSGVLYTRALTEYVLKEAAKSEIVKKQLADKNVNVFSGKRFDDEDKNTGLDFQDMVSIDEDALSKAFGVNISEDDIKKLTEGYIEKIALDENSEIIGYQYLSLGRFMDFVKAGVPAEEALVKARGQYGRFADAAKVIDPRKE